MSKSIAINAGSSSLKFQLFNMPQEEVVAKGLVERIGLGDSIFSISYGDDQKFEVVEDIPNHEVAVEKLLEQLVALNIISSFDEITGVGHRVVAGGELFKDSALVDDTVIQQVEDLAEFAPLHNKAEAVGECAHSNTSYQTLQVLLYSILHSIQQCLRKLTYTAFQWNTTKNSKLVNTELTEQATATFHAALLKC